MTTVLSSLIFIQVLALTWSRSRQKCRMCYEDEGEVSGTVGQETQLRLTRAQTRREKTSGNNSHFLSLLFFTSAFCFSPLLKAEATPQPEFISSELQQPTMTAEGFTGPPLRSFSSVQFSSVAQCPTLCNPMNRSTPGLPVHHQLLEFTQTHVHRVGDAIQPSQPLSSPSPPAFNLSQHQGLFK